MNVVETVKDVKAKMTGKHPMDPAPAGQPAPSRLVPPNPAFCPSSHSNDSGDESTTAAGGGNGYDSSSSTEGGRSPVTPPPMQHLGALGPGCKKGGILQNARRSLSGEEARGKAVERGPSFERKEARSVSAPTSKSVSDDEERPGRRSISPARRGGREAAEGGGEGEPGEAGRQREPSALKFAPLPDSGRPKRNSISLGVAARANLLSGQGDPMEGVHAVPPMPEEYDEDKEKEAIEHAQRDAYTVHDATKGMKKLFRRISRSSPPKPDDPDLPPVPLSERPSLIAAVHKKQRARAATVDDPTGGAGSRSSAGGRTQWVGIATRDIRVDSTPAPTGGPHAHDGENGTREVREIPSETSSSTDVTTTGEGEEEGDANESGVSMADEDREEEIKARSRSTTRAGGVEIIHKHKDDEHH